MTAPAIRKTMDSLHRAGLTVELTQDKGIKVSPASTVTNALRALIVANKTEIVAYLIEAANDAAPLAASECRITSDAMTSSQTKTFKARLSRFNSIGVIERDAKGLVEALVMRDREYDDRRLCFECLHLSGYGQSNWRCGNWQAAGVAIRARDAHLPVDLVVLLQRCAGYCPAVLNVSHPVDAPKTLASDLPEGELK